MSEHCLGRIVFFLIMVPFAVHAQVASDTVSPQNWQAPLYWQPTQVEREAALIPPDLLGSIKLNPTEQALSPALLLSSTRGGGTKAAAASANNGGPLADSVPDKSMKLDGLTNSITADNVTPLGGGKANEIYIGGDNSPGPAIPFSQIKVGIGTKSISTDSKVKIFDPLQPTLEVASLTARVQLAVATANGAYSSLAKPNSVVLRVGPGATNDFIISANDQTGALRFSTGIPDVERMTILHSGLVGIGTSNPSLALLDVNGKVRVENLNGGTQAKLVTADSNGVLGSLTFSNNPNDVLHGNGAFGPLATDDNDWLRSGGNMYPFNLTDRVGIGTASPMTRFHVIENTSPAGPEAVRIEFTGTLNQKGHLLGARAIASINSGFKGSAEGRLAEVTSFNAFGNMAGVTGIATPSSLVANLGSQPSFSVGGLFRNLPSSPPGFSPVGIVWVGGVYGEIANTYNANPADGAIAAVIGVDNSSSASTALHWAGYFSGKGFFQDAVGINTKNPTQMLDVNGKARIEDLTATGQALVTADPSGVLGSLTFSNNPNDVLHGNGTFGPVSLTGVTGSCSSGAGTITKWSSANAVGCSGIFEASTLNVGIGTVTPQAKLDVAGEINIGSAPFHYKIGSQTVLSIDGTDNVFVGKLAGASNATGTDNTFAGFEAGVSNTKGTSNTFLGAFAGLNNQIGSNNTFIGYGTANSHTAGNNNVFLGFAAGNNNAQSNNDIYIGNLGCTPAGCTENNTIRIGMQGTQVSTFIAGIAGATVSGVPVTINTTTGQLGVTASSRRFKEQISDMGDSSSRLFQLRPVTFFYKSQYDDGSHLLQYGLIAEEVAKVYPEMVTYGKDGRPFTVKYQLLAPMLLNELQKQQTVVTAHQDMIKAQQEQIQAQERQIEDLKRHLSRLESLLTHSSVEP